MIELEKLGAVKRLRMSTRVSRALGYTASAFFTRGALIDTGFPRVAEELDAVLDRLRPNVAIVTHHHEDHAGNVGLVARRGIPLAVSADTLARLRSHRRIGLYRRLLWGTTEPPPDPLVTVADIGEAGFALIPAPGHSADHHVVWDAEGEALFAGDLFLGVKVRAAHHREDPRRLVRSLRAAAALRPRVLFDAHRGRVNDPVGALTAKADWLEQTIATIDHRIAEGWSDRAIAREVLGREDAGYYVSRGSMGRINLVRAVRRSAPQAPTPHGMGRTETLHPPRAEKKAHDPADTGHGRQQAQQDHQRAEHLEHHTGDRHGAQAQSEDQQTFGGQAPTAQRRQH